MKPTPATKRFLQVILLLKDKGKDVTQSNLARILGTTQATVSLIKNGYRNLPLQKVPEFCKQYSVNPNFILMGKLPIFGPPSHENPSVDDLLSLIHELARRVDAVERRLKKK